MMDWPSKFVGFRVLEFFLIHPSLEIHLNELARNLDIARGSAKGYCDIFVDEGLILESSKGNLRLFRLNRDDFAVREVTKAYYLLKLKHLGIERLAKGCTSLAIYGSFARGDIDERSDLDLLVIGEDGSVDRDEVLKLQDALNREVQLTLLPYYRWETMKKNGDKFAESVLKKHVLVSGVEL
jgi:predicted nucleotidyltransferase